MGLLLTFMSLSINLLAVVRGSQKPNPTIGRAMVAVVRRAAGYDLFAETVVLFPRRERDTVSVTLERPDLARDGVRGPKGRGAVLAVIWHSGQEKVTWYIDRRSKRIRGGVSGRAVDPLRHGHYAEIPDDYDKAVLAVAEFWLKPVDVLGPWEVRVCGDSGGHSVSLTQYPAGPGSTVAIVLRRDFTVESVNHSY